jgi:nucleotide-binding universal stress UspA family protein
VTQFLVVGVDDSEAGRQALTWALSEGRDGWKTVRAVSVWSYDDSGVDALLNPGAVQEKTAQTLDLAIKEALDGQAPPPIDTVVRQGRPDEVLCEEASGARALVLGPPGTRRRSGHVVAACLRRAPCPVLVLPQSFEYPGGGRHRARRLRW